MTSPKTISEKPKITMYLNVALNETDLHSIYSSSKLIIIRQTCSVPDVSPIRSAWRKGLESVESKAVRTSTCIPSATTTM